MWFVPWLSAIFLAVPSQGIINKATDNSKIASKVDSIDESTKKLDIDAQASHAHSVFGGAGGFGDNQLGGGYGGGFGEGLGSYGGDGGGYGYDHHDDHHDHHHHYYPKEHHGGHGGGHHDGFHKALAIKGLLVPLAGVALLGAAAAFVSNPILLQLGVISGTYGRRRRRDTEIDEAAKLEAQTRLSEIQVLERFMSQVPKDEIYSQEKKLMASYLSCSGMTKENSCLERLACELHGPSAKQMPNETHVMAIVTNEIFNNDLVPAKTKEQMSEAVRRGLEGEDCAVYSCQDLEALIKQKQE